LGSSSQAAVDARNATRYEHLCRWAVGGGWRLISAAGGRSRRPPTVGAIPVSVGSLGAGTWDQRPSILGTAHKACRALAQPGATSCPTIGLRPVWGLDSTANLEHGEAKSNCPTPWQSPSATPQMPGPRSGTTPPLGLHPPGRATDSQLISTPTSPPDYPVPASQHATLGTAQCANHAGTGDLAAVVLSHHRVDGPMGLGRRRGW